MAFENFFTFLGGIAIFLFGMKSMAEGLRSGRESALRNLLRRLTTHRVMGLAVGIFVTTLVQSSSVTTVMTVGLVNGGWINLTQALGVILGANIGTTITGWIIAIKVGKYGLLLLGLGIFPWIFSKNAWLKKAGQMLASIGFVFLGLQYMGASFKPLKDTEFFLQLMQYFQADSSLSLLACVAVGACLTMIVQSSSAMLGVTMALAFSEAISFQTAVALVLGENIGTTITAILAGIGGNLEAKRAAGAHALVNVLGVVILLPFFWVYLDFIDWMVAGSAAGVLIGAHIAAAHTCFNLMIAFVFLPFLTPLAKFVVWLTPEEGWSSRASVPPVVPDESGAEPLR